MADLRTCPGCGMRHARGEDVEPCASCMLDGWAVGLGRAIRRFVRRAEAAELVEEVSNASRMLAWVALNDPTEDLTRIDDALSRLASLAMEVEP